MRGHGTEDGSARWVRLPEYIYAVVAESPESVLLETARFDSLNQYSYLFLKPIRVITANHLDEIPQLFTRIEKARAEGLYIAGYMSYEAGYHFERVNGPLSIGAGQPLAWFGVYSTPAIFDHAQGRFLDSVPAQSAQQLREGAGPVAQELTLEIGKAEYFGQILHIKTRIAAGETYQVNFTDRVSFSSSASPAATFAALAKQQPVAYTAFLNAAGRHILSFSPELFFRVEDGKIMTRPMKGTMPRGLDANEDARMAAHLQSDEKNRSEHVMIVDLLRNDLGRICTTGSIRVDDLFSVEQYETLLQMTSTVSGTLHPKTSYYDIFRSLFPSGSVTGAPKIQTMGIIRQLERNPRGIYTGAIGFIAPNGTSVFNVAIRTLVIKDGMANMGVGGGIVADSEPADEYRECLLKSSFITRPRREFQVIETMLWKDKYCLLSMHMERLESSAAYFNFAWDRNAVLSRLRELSDSFTTGVSYRIRLLLGADGNFTLAGSELHAAPATDLIWLSPERTSSADVFVRHKTTLREIYDHGYAEARSAGFDEVIFQNEKGEITEGAISNIFIRKNGKLLTPPLSCGVLPGVFRRHLLETDTTAQEQVMTVEDLKAADAVFLCNSVRGLREVKSMCFEALPITCSKAHT
jgi:para-aminobenzoate synthetase/4-amino-4-deoxychorismate lyase